MINNILQNDNTGNIHEGIMIVLSSPSGTGKTTITRKLIENCNNIKLSISATTRNKCENEENFKDYIFVTNNEFDKLIQNDEILEYAYIFGNRYGTLKNIQLSLLQGQDILFDIDWQGAKELKKLFPDRVITIFIIPPDFNDLKTRLLKRNRDQDNIDIRLAQYCDDIKHFDRYDYIVMNDDLNVCVLQISSIIAAERQKTSRQRIVRQHLQNEIVKYKTK